MMKPLKKCMEYYRAHGLKKLIAATIALYGYQLRLRLLRNSIILHQDQWKARKNHINLHWASWSSTEQGS